MILPCTRYSTAFPRADDSIWKRWSARVQEESEQAREGGRPFPGEHFQAAVAKGKKTGGRHCRGRQGRRARCSGAFTCAEKKRARHKLSGLWASISLFLQHWVMEEDWTGHPPKSLLPPLLRDLSRTPLLGSPPLLLPSHDKWGQEAGAGLAGRAKGQKPALSCPPRQPCGSILGWRRGSRPPFFCPNHAFMRVPNEPRVLMHFRNLI